ncbi:MAG: hypothetical protein GX158_04315 [Bacteroidales bacterium]|nr:hypothetical protein [Bacteroidales bacterium]
MINNDYFCNKDSDMSGSAFSDLKRLNKKLDELLSTYENLKSEFQDLEKNNEELRMILHEREERIKELEIKYERVKLSGALLGDSGNTGEAKRKITELVREIDRCVALLNR